MITWLQYYKLKPLQPLFSQCENDTQPKLFRVAPSKWGDFEQREILWLEKLIQIFPPRTVTICEMLKSNRYFCTLDMLGEINFRSKLHLKTLNFLSENCCLGKKRRSKVMETFRKFREWWEETFSDWSTTQTPCNMAVFFFYHMQRWPPRHIVSSSIKVINKSPGISIIIQIN